MQEADESPITPLPGDDLSRRSFLVMGVFFEAGLALLALVLAWFAGIDVLGQLQLDTNAFVTGAIATVPIFLVFLLMYFVPLGPLLKIKRLLLEVLGPPLATARWYELMGLAILVGFCEEFLFRGVIQPWMCRHGLLFGLIGSNLLFGLAHFVTPLYALIAGLLGLYLGWLLQGPASDNLVTPIVTHALYDYFAFLVVIREVRQQRADRTKL